MANEKLRVMINNADSQVEALNDSTTQLDIQIIELESQRDAIQFGLLDIITNDSTGYLIYKMQSLNGYEVTYDDDFGVSTVRNFHILDSAGETIYEYPGVTTPSGIGWDDDQQIIDYIDKFDFGWDYIHHQIGLTGTFGIQSRIDQLETAKGLLVANKNKIENSKSVFEDYA